MKKFDFSRYILLCRKQFVEDYRRHIIFTAVMSTVLFFLLWFVNWQLSMLEMTMDTGFTSGADLTFLSWLKIFYFLFVLMLVIGYQSAHCMPFMRTKTAQISYIMLPATTFEKYAVAQTFAFGFSILEAIIAFFVADGLQYAINSHFTLAEIFSSDVRNILTMTLLQGSVIPDKMMVFGCLLPFTSLFIFSAWYTLCATLFRKHPFLFGTLILLGINQVLSMVYSIIYSNMMVTDVEVDINSILERTSIVLAIIVIVQFVLAVCLWMWSYFRMKRVEL